MADRDEGSWGKSEPLQAIHQDGIVDATYWLTGTRTWDRREVGSIASYSVMGEDHQLYVHENSPLLAAWDFGYRTAQLNEGDSLRTASWEVICQRINVDFDEDITLIALLMEEFWYGFSTGETDRQKRVRELDV